MSRRSTAYVLGFHGCRKSVADKALAGEELLKSEKDYDWLGPGVYFWESDPVRAKEWSQRYASESDGPASVGAMIDLGNCLDLTLRENFDYLRLGFQDLKASTESAGESLPENRDPKNATGNDKVLRFLDCAVIRRVHTLIDRLGLDAFDTVRGMFTEGDPVYENGRFLDKTHTQIAVLNPKCIKAVFVPRDGDEA